MRTYHCDVCKNVIEDRKSVRVLSLGLDQPENQPYISKDLCSSCSDVFNDRVLKDVKKLLS